MPVTCCVSDFSKRLRKLPESAWKREADKLPESCMFDCSPGGCRKHCGDYVEAQIHKLNHSPKITKPPKGKRK